jgi:general L-amino acid transport system permease protein
LAVEIVGEVRRRRASFWNDRAVRGVLFQIVVAATVVAIAWYLFSNTLHNLATRHISTGFGFLDREAGFEIGESWIPYSPADPYYKAIIVGLINTAVVSVVGIVLCTLIGTVIGIARLSSNFLVAKLAAAYVEIVRNTPVLLQLLFWYVLIGSVLPGPRQAWQPLPGVFLSNRGLRFPAPIFDSTHDIMLMLAAAGAVLAFLWSRYAKHQQAATGHRPPVLVPTLVLVLVPPLLWFFAAGAPSSFDVPELRGFNFAGGIGFSPEMTALTLGLTIYTASYVAETVRAGILAVAKGQTEAARALGLPPGRVLRLVVLPQAVRIIIPPLISFYLDLTKNSSLAIAIGYPDLVSVTSTIINQTGQAIEGVMIQMGIYLIVSLAISAVLNWYNARIALLQR